MGLIQGIIPAPIPGTIPQGNGRDRKGMERESLATPSIYRLARPELGEWMAATRRDPR
jgi:hypothetical protein